MTTDAPELYRKHFIAKADERLDLFTLLGERFAIGSALYAGSFTHITPAFVFPETCFVDMDRRAARFFTDPAVRAFVCTRKHYPEEPTIRFHQADYAQGFAENDGSFDLLISQYAGFVSQGCKRYLRIGGYLLANNSHGDAGLAAIDPDYRFLAIINRHDEHFSLAEHDLETYFVPKKPISLTREYLEQLGRGIGYTRTAWAYVFERVG
jgi:hypothetical protein